MMDSPPRICTNYYDFDLMGRTDTDLVATTEGYSSHECNGDRHHNNKLIEVVAAAPVDVTNTSNSTTSIRPSSPLSSMEDNSHHLSAPLYFSSTEIMRSTSSFASEYTSSNGKYVHPTPSLQQQPNHSSDNNISIDSGRNEEHFHVLNNHECTYKYNVFERGVSTVGGTYSGYNNQEEGYEQTIDNFKEYLKSIMKQENDHDSNCNFVDSDDEAFNMDISTISSTATDDDDDDDSDVDHDGDVASRCDGNNSGNSNSNSNSNSSNNKNDGSSGGITTNWPERLFSGSPEAMIDAPKGILLVFDRMLDYCVPSARYSQKNNNCAACFADFDDNDDVSSTILSYHSLALRRHLSKVEAKAQVEETDDDDVDTNGSFTNISDGDLLLRHRRGNSDERSFWATLVDQDKEQDDGDSGGDDDELKCMMFPCTWNESIEPMRLDSTYPRPVEITVIETEKNPKKRRLLSLAATDVDRKKRCNQLSTTFHRNLDVFDDGRADANRNSRGCDADNFGNNIVAEETIISITNDDDNDDDTLFEGVDNENDKLYRQQRQRRREAASKTARKYSTAPILLENKKGMHIGERHRRRYCQNDSDDKGNHNNSDGDEDDSTLSEIFEGLQLESPSEERDELGCFLDSTSITDETTRCSSTLSYSSGTF